MKSKAKRNLFDELNEGFDALAAQRAEAVNEMVRRDCEQFRNFLLDGIKATPVGRMDIAYFADLRTSLKTQHKPKTREPRPCRE